MTWMEAARLTAVERIPAVSQVSTLPVGGLGKMQARQAVAGTGSRFEVRGSRASGEDVHGGGVGADGGGVDPGGAALDGEVVDEVTGLEVVGGVEDDRGAGWGGARSSAMLVGVRSAMRAWTATLELKRAMWRRAASALGRESRASASSKRTWRWRLEGSTKSRSMRVRAPTPARASSEAEAAPMAPQPTMATWDAARRCWPRGPMPGKSTWRE